MGHFGKMSLLETFKMKETKVVFNRMTSIDCRLGVSLFYFRKEKLRFEWYPSSLFKCTPWFLQML